MSISEIEFIRHIEKETRFLVREGTKLSVDQFISDEVASRACIRAIEVIGEATKRVSTDFRSRYPNVEWRKMAAMRDRLIHGYFEVDLVIVYNVMTEFAPKLLGELEKIIQLESKS